MSTCVPGTVVSTSTIPGSTFVAAGGQTVSVPDAFVTSTSTITCAAESSPTSVVPVTTTSVPPVVIPSSTSSVVVEISVTTEASSTVVVPPAESSTTQPATTSLTTSDVVVPPVVTTTSSSSSTSSLASSTSSGLSTSTRTGTSTRSVSILTSTQTSSSTPSAMAVSSSSNAGKIAGGVIGGLAGLALLGLLAFLILKKRRRDKALEQSNLFEGAPAHFDPHQAGGLPAETPYENNEGIYATPAAGMYEPDMPPPAATYGEGGGYGMAGLGAGAAYHQQQSEQYAQPNEYNQNAGLGAGMAGMGAGNSPYHDYPPNSSVGQFPNPYSTTAIDQQDSALTYDQPPIPPPPQQQQWRDSSGSVDSTPPPGAGLAVKNPDGHLH